MDHIIMKDFINPIRELRLYPMEKNRDFKQRSDMLRFVFNSSD